MWVGDVFHSNLDPESTPFVIFAQPDKIIISVPEVNPCNISKFLIEKANNLFVLYANHYPAVLWSSFVNISYKGSCTFDIRIDTREDVFKDQTFLTRSVTFLCEV